MSLKYQVWSALELVPKGQVTTYRLLSDFVGTRAVRAVASWVGENPNAPRVPCHRVVLADGRVGQYSGVGGVERKIKLLRSEGIKVKEGKIADFNQRLFRFKFNHLIPKGYQLVLASASPRRQALVKQLGLKFKVVPANIDETSLMLHSVSNQVKQLALAKAKSIVRQLSLPSVVIGADTLVEFQGQALGKPVDMVEAKKMLVELSHQSVRVFSGLAVVFFDHQGQLHHQTCVSSAQVKFKPLTQRTINWYVATGEPLDKAGAFAVQGVGLRLIAEIKGDYWGAVGLSLKDLVAMLSTTSSV